MIIVDNKNKSYYFAEIVDVLNGSNGKKILSPDPSNTPEYYREKKFKTWYRLQNIQPIESSSIDLDNLVLRYRLDSNLNRIPFLDRINSRPSFMYVIDEYSLK